MYNNAIYRLWCSNFRGFVNLETTNEFVSLNSYLKILYRMYCSRIMYRERLKKSRAVYGNGTSFVLGEISYFVRGTEFRGNAHF